MYLKSPSLEEGSRMPAKHSLNGGNPVSYTHLTLPTKA